MARCNQVLASVQSRITVPGETPSTSAVSSMLNPPKNRNSTIWLLRGSSSERLVSASSSATTSAARSSETASASSNDTLSAPPPRFWYCRARLIDQDAPHHLRRDGEEMGAILPFHRLLVDQAQVGFVNESRCLQSVAAALAPQIEPPYLINTRALPRGNRRMRTLAVLICLLAFPLLTIFPGSAHSLTAASANYGRTFLIFGPADFQRTAGKPAQSSHRFSIQNPIGPYILRVFNGGKNSQFARSSSATIRLNGVEVVQVRDFNQHQPLIERKVALAHQNILLVELRSAPGSGLTIEIAGIDLSQTSQVGPDGGTIVAMGGRVRLAIPPGALAQATGITVRPIPPSPGDPLSDTAFDFEPDGTRFLRPVALTLSYNPAAVTEERVAALRIAKLLEDGTERLTPPGTVDRANHAVTAEIHGFSSYRVTLQCSNPAAVCLSPPQLAAQYMPDRTINLTWTYPPLQGVAQYVEIERAVVRGGGYCSAGEPYCVCDSDGCRLNGLQPPHDADYTHLLILDSSMTSYSDGDIASDSAFYWYRIRWLSTLISHPSEPAKAFVFGLPDTPPDPATLSATALTCGGIELEWSLVDGLSNGLATGEAAGYRVERALAGGDFQYLAFLPAENFASHPVATYIDTHSTIEGENYTYRVISVSGSRSSPGNTQAMAVAPPDCSPRTSITLMTYAEHALRNALWVGVREGTGEWRQVSGVGGSYSFDVMAGASEGRYSLAVVCQNGLQIEGRILEMTTDDPHVLAVTCGRQAEERDHAITVNTRNAPPFTCVTGAAGDYAATSCQPDSWTVPVFTGNYDIVTIARNFSDTAASRIAIASNIEVRGPRLFTHEEELALAFAAEPHGISVTGTSGTVSTRAELLTALGTRAMLGSGLGSANYGGLPLAAQRSGDIHRASATSVFGEQRRRVLTYFKTPVDLEIDFSSMPPMAIPEVYIASRMPYLRVAAGFFFTPISLPEIAGVELQYRHVNPATDSSRTWRVFISRNSLAIEPRMYELPDFRSAPGWQIGWELPETATSFDWTFTAYLTNGDNTTFINSLFYPLNAEGAVLPEGFVRRELTVSRTYN